METHRFEGSPLLSARRCRSALPDRPLATATLLLYLLSGCGSSDYGAPAGAGPAGTSGGNVGFGGAQDSGEWRNALANGRIPGDATLDAGGFFAEHFIAPAPADCGGVLCLDVRSGAARDWFGAGRHDMARIALTSVIDPAHYQRKPLNLVLVVDRSGSMESDGRLLHVKAGLRQMVAGLDAQDRVALVSFDSQARVDVTFAQSSNRAALLAAIERLTPGSSTNIYDGLTEGFAQFGNDIVNERQNRLLLLSDGLATAGNTDRNAMIALAESQVRRGLGLSTIGVGNSFDTPLMRGLAERAGGNFYFVEDAAAVTEVFTKELDYFISPLALDVNIAVTAGQGMRLGEGLGAATWQTLGSGERGIAKLPAVFVASRTSQPDPSGRRGGGGSLMLHLIDERTGVAMPGLPGGPAMVELTYRLPNQTTRQRQVAYVTLATEPDAAGNSASALPAPIADAYVMANVFRGLRLATQLANAGQQRCAAEVVAVTQRELAAYLETHENADLRADAVMLTQFAQVLPVRNSDVSPSLACVAEAQVCVNRECGCDAQYCQQEADAEDYNLDCGATACAASGGRGGCGAVLVFFALVFVGRRRRTLAA